MPNETDTIIVGDALETLRGMAAGSIHCCVTSPPYWGLRSYLPDAVVLVDGAPPEVLAELNELGIRPID